MTKIQQWSGRFGFFFKILLVVIPLTAIAFWIAPEAISNLAPGKYLGPEYIINFAEAAPLYDWNIGTRLLALLLTFIPVGLNMLILVCLIRLFKLYQQGIIFTGRNAYLIRKAGIFMLIKVAINPFYQAVLTLVLTWHNPPGQRFIAIAIEPGFFSNLFMALLIILISWIMLEGNKLQEEQSLTV